MSQPRGNRQEKGIDNEQRTKKRYFDNEKTAESSIIFISFSVHWVYIEDKTTLIPEAMYFPGPMIM